MMEYNVLVPFIYTPTGKGYNEGSTFATEDGERALILVEKGFLKEKQTAVLHKDETVLTAKEAEKLVDLKTKARVLKIKGYTKMSLEQLEEAIVGSESQKASD